MAMKAGTLVNLVSAVAVVAIAAASCSPVEAQLVYSNPRINDGQIRVDPLLCQTDYQIRRSLAAAGFTNIFLNAPIDTRIRARATKGGVVYLIDYDYCLNPGIVGQAPLRSAR
ncbi:MAG TPA: hypothetical protein VN541_09145 [Tepidisphaeraceae bacterium]|jgi:hypothetical protein|nr:hypothetical protein [Tepidisphaeraceae bacterium]